MFGKKIKSREDMNYKNTQSLCCMLKTGHICIHAYMSKCNRLSTATHYVSFE